MFTECLDLVLGLLLSLVALVDGAPAPSPNDERNEQVTATVEADPATSRRLERSARVSLTDPYYRFGRGRSDPARG